MRLSILIVNWNTRDDLERCLASLEGARGQGAGVGYESPAPSTQHPAPSLAPEIIVVDNASTDGSAEMVRDIFPWVTLLAMGENWGYAAGNNLAAEASRGDFLLFLNPDTVVPEEAPERLIAFLEEHPKAGLVAPRLLNPDGTVQPSVRGMPTPGALVGAWLWLDRLFPRHPVWASYRLPAFEYGKTQKVPQPMAAAWMVRRAAWEDVGPFDEDFPLFFNDVDWCLRAQQKGWEIWYDADVAIEHRGGASTSQVKPHATRESHRALVAFYKKHYADRLGPVGLAATTAAIRTLGEMRATWYQRQRGGA